MATQKLVILFPVEELFFQLNNVIHVKTENLHGNICWKHFILEKENLQKFLRKMKYFNWFGGRFYFLGGDFFGFWCFFLWFCLFGLLFLLFSGVFFLISTVNFKNAVFFFYFRIIFFKNI